MVHGRSGALRRRLVVAVTGAALVMATLVTVEQRPAAAAITAVKGSACGFYVNVGLFGGPQARRGCGAGLLTTSPGYSPEVALPADGSGSATVISGTDLDGAYAQYGPARIFAGLWPLDVAVAPPSGPITVTTVGTPAGGSVTSTAMIELRDPPDPASPGGFGPGPVEGDKLRTVCTADGATVTGTTEITNGILSTSTDAGGSPVDQEPIPQFPAPNYTRSGVITNVGDVFSVVFNEQIVHPDGSLTVNAFHMYLFGPTAVGESVGGQVTCGATPTTVSPNDIVSPSCGIPVVKPMGPEDPTPLVPRQELVGVFDAGGLQSITNIQVANGTVQLGDPSSFYAYLHFTPGQTGPLPITARRSDDAEAAGLPLVWSFDATDISGNVRHCEGVTTATTTTTVPTTGTVPPTSPSDPATIPATTGYRLVGSDGGIFAFGAARFFGSTGALTLNKPIVGTAPTPSGAGYWLVASDGGIFAFGDARFLGSTGALTLNKPIVGMAPTPSGAGYWLVASDGGIFAFGDARFLGSTGALTLNKPIVGMAPTPSGAGYWLVASDGGIFAFGGARFFGSTGALTLNKPIVAMAATPAGAGYHLVASDGGIFAFGDARFFGSTGAMTLNKPIVAISVTRTPS